jgi:nicotinate-nucleotide--dimethylbenzimidazole phosphoribosyltransferase
VQLTKPAGSLGRLEEIAEWMAAWQGTARPHVDNPLVAVFAGNHGVVAQGVSAYPASVTQAMVANFTAGGAAMRRGRVVEQLFPASDAAGSPLFLKN